MKLFHGTYKYNVRPIAVEGFSDSGDGSDYDEIREKSGKSEIVFFTDNRELLDYNYVIEVEAWDAYNVNARQYGKHEFVASPDDTELLAVWVNGKREDIEEWL